MLENDGVGQRSGTRPLRGLVVSQKKRKVRRSTSSMVVVGAATARLRGASAEEWQDAPRRISSAANAADVRRTLRLEVQFEADLLATSERDDAIRLAQICAVVVVSDEVVQATVAREVERVEDLRDETDARTRECFEVFLQSEIDVAEPETAALRRINRSLLDACGEPAGQTKTLGEIRNRCCPTTAERYVRAEAHVPGNAEDPSGGEMVWLRAWDWV